MSVGEFSLILLKCVIYFLRVLEKYKYPVYNITRSNQRLTKNR